MSAMIVKHRDWCSEPELAIHTGRFGDPIAQCPECKRWEVAEDGGGQRLVEEPAEPVTGHRWVCGEHPSQGVDWRGRGCPSCRKDRARRAREREEARLARMLAAAERAHYTTQNGVIQ